MPTDMTQLPQLLQQWIDLLTGDNTELVEDTDILAKYENAPLDMGIELITI
jgi:hypothetical protein